MVFEKKVQKIPFAVQEKERKKLQLLTATGITNPVDVLYQSAKPSYTANGQSPLTKGSKAYQESSPFIRGRNPTHNAFKEFQRRQSQDSTPQSGTSSPPASGFKL